MNSLASQRWPEECRFSRTGAILAHDCSSRYISPSVVGHKTGYSVLCTKVQHRGCGRRKLLPQARRENRSAVFRCAGTGILLGGLDDSRLSRIQNAGARPPLSLTRSRLARSRASSRRPRLACGALHLWSRLGILGARGGIITGCCQNDNPKWGEKYFRFIFNQIACCFLV